MSPFRSPKTLILVLICFLQINKITDSGIHSSLHSNCHHQKNYGNFNLKIFFPPLYERHVWYYKHARSDLISKAIQGFGCNKAFSDISTDEKASILTKAILNIMSNFILNEIVAIDDSDPPRINNKIKSSIKTKTEYFKNCVGQNNPESLRYFEQIQYALQKNLKFLIKIIISNFLENFQLRKSILNVTGAY